MNRALSPDLLAARANQSLKALSNRNTAAKYRSYFKPEEKIWLYGVSTRQVRQVEREIHCQVGREWSVSQATEFCDALLRKKYMEPKGVGIELLARHKRHFQKGLLNKIKSWLEENLCDNWAVADALALRLLAPLLSRFPELIEEVRGWTDSKNLWLRRSAAVGLVPLARKGEHLDTAYLVAESLFAHEEDLIHKATGWLLREAGKRDPERLRTFLLVRGPRIPRTAVRYAIEKFPPQERKVLLSRTRPCV